MGKKMLFIGFICLSSLAYADQFPQDLVTASQNIATLAWNANQLCGQTGLFLSNGQCVRGPQSPALSVTSVDAMQALNELQAAEQNYFARCPAIYGQFACIAALHQALTTIGVSL